MVPGGKREVVNLLSQRGVYVPKTLVLAMTPVTFPTRAHPMCCGPEWIGPGELPCSKTFPFAARSARC